MKTVIEKLKAEIDVLEGRVKAKETILKCVFSDLQSTSRDRQMVHKVLGVRPKESSVVSHISLDQRWCVAFEDTVCVSFDVANISEQNHMQPVCHTLDSSGFVRCVLLNEGSEIHLIRPNSSAEMLVGFSKSQLFRSKSCPFLLEMILHASDEITLGVDIFARSAASQTRLHSDTRVVTVSAPSKWYSFEDFLSAKEPEILLLLRCLRVGCFSHAMRPTSSFEFAEANPDFDCCDFGDWQVFVGHGLMNGLVAVSSTMNHPHANIDRIYGINEELLSAFVKRFQ